MDTLNFFRLGVITNLTIGQEPEAFTKAWNGNLQIHTDDKYPKRFLRMGNDPLGQFWQQVEDSSLSFRKNRSCVTIDEQTFRFLQTRDESLAKMLQVKSFFQIS